MTESSKTLCSPCGIQMLLFRSRKTIICLSLFFAWVFPVGNFKKQMFVYKYEANPLSKFQVIGVLQVKWQCFHIVWIVFSLRM